MTEYREMLWNLENLEIKMLLRVKKLEIQVAS